MSDTPDTHRPERDRRPRRQLRDWPASTTAAEERSLVRERIDGLHERIEDVVEDLGDVRAELADVRDDQKEMLRLMRSHTRPSAFTRIAEAAVGKEGANVRWLVLGAIALAVLGLGSSAALSYGGLTLSTGTAVQAPHRAPLPAPSDTDASVDP